MTGGKKVCIAALFILVTSVFFASGVSASEGGFIVSEISPYGTASKDEFIELYNPTDVAIDFTGWSLKKQTASGRFYTLVSEFNSGIEPKSYFVIAHKEGYEADYIPDQRYTTKNSISSNNKIIFYDNNGEEILSLAWGDVDGSIFANPDPGESVSIKDGEYVFGNPSPGSEYTHGGDGGIGNSYGQYFFQNGAPILAINEVSPYDGGWVELFSNIDHVLSLDGWVLKSNAEVIRLSGDVQPHRWFVHRGVVVPASGGQVELYAPDGVLVDDIYMKDIARFIPRGASVIRKRDGHDYGSLHDFALSGNDTPGDANKLEGVIPVLSEPTSEIDPNTYVQNQKVYISEVLPNPEGSDSDGEFIEVHNHGPYSIEITNWVLSDSSKKYVFPYSVINPDEYVVIFRADSGIALNNSGEEEVFLFDSNNRLIDSVVYEGSHEGFSWNAGDVLYEQRPSPGVANYEEVFSEAITIDDEAALVVSNTEKTVPPIQTEHRMYYPLINEFVPNPSGPDSEEWIELYNPYDIPLSLDGLLLDDKDGGSRPFALDGVMDAHAFKVVTREDSGIALNNTFDEVRLLQKEIVIESVEYSGVIEDYSYARFEDDFFWTEAVTRNAQSKLQLITDSESVNRKGSVVYSVDAFQLSQYEKGDRVRVQGVVTVLPGVLGGTFFYIDGAQVYSHKKQFPEIAIGDHLSVEGVLSFAGGVPRIKTSSQENIVVISHRDEIYTEAVEIGGVTQEHLGRLVSLQGVILEKQRNKLFVDDGSGEVVVYMKSGIGVSVGDFQEGAEVTVNGVITKVLDNIEVQPRGIKDISVMSPRKELESPLHVPVNVVEKSYHGYFWALFLGLLAFGFYRLLFKVKKLT